MPHYYIKHILNHEVSQSIKALSIIAFSWAICREFELRTETFALVL